MANQPVHILEYDPTWPDRFADQQTPVTAVLGPWLAAPVEHIGSTSVPGLPAKPVIDMLAPVRSLTAAQAAVARLTEAGWLFWPEDPRRGYRLWFLRPRPEARTHHLHVIEQAHPQAVVMLAFRDLLRADPELCLEYATLKKALAHQHGLHRNAYTNSKTTFIDGVLRAAGIEPPPRIPLPE